MRHSQVFGDTIFISRIKAASLWGGRLWARTRAIKVFAWLQFNQTAKDNNIAKLAFQNPFTSFRFPLGFLELVSPSFVLFRNEPMGCQDDTARGTTDVLPTT
jgi:hypothetical protein